jgi:hypothetical protein
MDPNQVIIRTAKGQEELRARSYNLSPHQHRLLIEVDERATLGETLSRLSQLGDGIEAEIDGLLANGFLALRRSACETAAYTMDDWETASEELGTPEDAAPAGVAIHHHAEFNLDKAKGFARFVVLGALGPAGSHRIERIESAQDVHELRAQLDELRDLLPQLLSKRQAKQVWEQLEPLMLSIR